MTPEQWKETWEQCKLLNDMARMLGRAIVDPQSAEKSSRLPFLQPKYAGARSMFAPTGTRYYGSNDLKTVWDRFRGQVSHRRKQSRVLPGSFIGKLHDRSRHSDVHKFLSKHYPSIHRSVQFVDCYEDADAFMSQGLQLRVPFYYAGTAFKLSVLPKMGENFTVLASRRIGEDEDSESATYRIKVVGLEPGGRAGHRKGRSVDGLLVEEKFLIENGREWVVGDQLLKTRLAFKRLSTRAFMKELA